MKSYSLMSPDEFCQPNGPGVKLQLRYYKAYLAGLKKASKTDRVARSDFQNSVITQEIIADYEAGRIPECGRDDMVKEWRRKVWEAIEQKKPVSLAAEEYGVALPTGYVKEKDRFVFKL